MRLPGCLPAPTRAEARKTESPIMRVDLRFAGLSEQAELRLRLAETLLAALQFQAAVAAWDGTRCDVLVVQPDDAYGR